VLILHWDQKVIDQPWLARYFPEAFAVDRRRSPSLNDVRAGLGPGTQVIRLLVPHDCQDGFGAAYWRRSHAYLDPAVRAGISMLAQTGHQRGDGLTRLRRDLGNGTWAARHRTLRLQPPRLARRRLPVRARQSPARRRDHRAVPARQRRTRLRPGPHPRIGDVLNLLAAPDPP
jgi:hypothetical protein